jgi:hypothetical protein
MSAFASEPGLDDIRDAAGHDTSAITHSTASQNVGGNPSRVRISYSPQPPARANECSDRPAVGAFVVAWSQSCRPSPTYGQARTSTDASAGPTGALDRAPRIRGRIPSVPRELVDEADPGDAVRCDLGGQRAS